MLLIGNQGVHCLYFSKIDNLNKYNVKVLSLIPNIMSICLKLSFKGDLSKFYYKNLGYFITFYFLLSQFPSIKRNKILSSDVEKDYNFSINLINFNQIYSFLNLLFLEKIKTNIIESTNKFYFLLPIQSLILSPSLNHLLRNKNLIHKNMLSQINITILTQSMNNLGFSFKNFPLLWFNKKVSPPLKTN